MNSLFRGTVKTLTSIPYDYKERNPGLFQVRQIFKLPRRKVSPIFCTESTVALQPVEAGAGVEGTAELYRIEGSGTGLRGGTGGTGLSQYVTFSYRVYVATLLTVVNVKQSP